MNRFASYCLIGCCSISPLPFYIAREKGFYEKAGIRVNPIFAGGGDQMQIMVAGEADIAVGVGLLATVSALEKGAPLKIISAEMRGLSDIFWHVKADSPVKKIEDLAGRKIGYSNPGSSSKKATSYFVIAAKAAIQVMLNFLDSGSR
jgi:ABC-type nitrate/sulfonate/bicarbonate transport system substrate-binding protein